MKQPISARRQLLKYVVCLVGATLLCAGVISAVLAHAAEDTAVPAWATPEVMAVRRVSALPGSQHEPDFLNNLDCSLLTYRLSAGKAMQTGCFTETAFGLLDSDTDMVLFNGTDEGVPLLPYSAHEVLAPWPGTLDLIALDAANTGGSYISLYKNPLGVLQDQRNVLLQLTAKQLTAPPELPLMDASGKPLVINPQTMAFSDNGSWLVAETLSGSFIRINLATLDMTAFAPAFGSQGSPALLKSEVAVSSNGRYVAIANKDAGSLKVYDLNICGTDTAGLQQRCAAYDYQPFVGRQIAGFQTAKHLRFVNDGLLSFESQASDPSGSGVYELAPKDSINSFMDYLGLGDSYTSGEGAFDYTAGTDTSDDMCHLSVHSYPLLLTHDLFSGVGGHSVACSGARINDVGSASPDYKGQVRGAGSLQQLEQTSDLLGSIMAAYMPGYVAQQRFVRQYQPGITTVSVGGNDIGFGDILEKCVAPHISLRPDANTCYSSYEDRLEVTNLIDRTVPRWTALYKQLLGEAPGTQLYVIGYPQTVSTDGNCALNVHLDTSEREFAAGLIDYLNNAIEQAAGAAGAHYVDISQALAGHRLCEAASYDVAVNGLTAGTDAGPLGIRIFGKESYHPNALGQALMEQAILKQTDNLTSAQIDSVGSSALAILSAPKTGRAINTLVPDDDLTAGVAQAGKSLAVQANGAQDGLRSGTAYTIRLDSFGGPILGSMATDKNGDISTNVSLPDSTTSGAHTIDVTGINQADEPVDVTQPIYVPVSDNDADGDGIPDNLDTCPGAVNSGQDSDRDGIDDACDGFIGSPPASSGQTGPSSGNLTGPGNSPSTVDTLGQTNSPPPVSDYVTAGIDLGDSRFTTAVATLVPGTSKAIPVTMANPNNAVSKGFRLLIKPQSAQAHRPFPKLYVINWLKWLILAVIIWLLAILGLWVKHSLDNRSRLLQAGNGSSS